jgi:hypothetical protein
VDLPLAAAMERLFRVREEGTYLFMQVAADGANSGEYLTRIATGFTIKSVSPGIVTPPYALVDGDMEVAAETCTLEDVTASLLHPGVVYLPLMLKAYP